MPLIARSPRENSSHVLLFWLQGDLCNPKIFIQGQSSRTLCVLEFVFGRRRVLAVLAVLWRLLLRAPHSSGQMPLLLPSFADPKLLGRVHIEACSRKVQVCSRKVHLSLLLELVSARDSRAPQRFLSCLSVPLTYSHNLPILLPRIPLHSRVCQGHLSHLRDIIESAHGRPHTTAHHLFDDAFW